MVSTYVSLSYLNVSSIVCTHIFVLVPYYKCQSACCNTYGNSHQQSCLTVEGTQCSEATHTMGIPQQAGCLCSAGFLLPLLCFGALVCVWKLK